MVLGKGRGKTALVLLPCLFVLDFLIFVCFVVFICFVCFLVCLVLFSFGGGGEGVKGVVFIFFLEAFVCFFELTWKGKVTTMPATNKAVAIFRDSAVLSPYFVRLLKGRLSNKLGSVF